MARHTSLYQSPRSPLIQGRTRWERPLWQPWLAGAVVSGVGAGAFLVWLQPRVGASGEVTTLAPAAIWLALLAVVAGAGIGAATGRSLGWRWRWLAAALAGAASFGIVLAAMNVFGLSVFVLVGGA